MNVSKRGGAAHGGVGGGNQVVDFPPDSSPHATFAICVKFAVNCVQYDFSHTRFFSSLLSPSHTTILFILSSSSHSSVRKQDTINFQLLFLPLPSGSRYVGSTCAYV